MKDIELDIAVGHSAQSAKWTNTKIRWSKLCEKMSVPTVTPETLQMFMRASKADQQKIKDVGGFVGGYLDGGKRTKPAVRHRQLVTLDIDFSHSGFWFDFTNFYPCAALLHSTHKSCPERPRHRLIIPLDRPVNQDEYQAIARKIAGNLNIDLFDRSTFDINRLMYWPSVSCDSVYEYKCQEGEILSADDVLAEYVDWRDMSAWPSVINEEDIAREVGKTQEDPTAKTGLIGAFCRAYTISEAIATFLPDAYEQTGENRYTYIKGSTASGMITYADKWAYSHHGTDPASNKLCNAFDLVRIHKFGGLDKSDAEKESTSAMMEFVRNDAKTKIEVATETFQEAKEAFGDGFGETEEVDLSWTEGMDVDKQGRYESTSNNINLILLNDSKLKGAFRYNEFDNKRYIFKPMPWRSVVGAEYAKDVDYSGLRNYIECVYGITGSQKIDDALAIVFEQNRFHPIRDYINGLEWDGVERIDSLLIDYFGADDNAYTRAAIRKMLVAAVARIFEPGVKFDLVLVLSGEQGTYKSTFLKKLGKEWFTDTFTTVQGKESFEQIQGFWIVEIAELSGLKKAEIETVKHYITKREDSFRPAYGRTVETYKRQCVFFGTTNTKDFLRDTTGNRRFLPIDVCREKAAKSVMDDLTGTVVDQIWAEAYALYMGGETLYLSDEVSQLAEEEQMRHSEFDDRTGLVQDYLDRLYPEDWEEKDLSERRMWLNNDRSITPAGSVRKDSVCIAEIWCECLGKEKSDLTRYNTKEINDIMKSLGNWTLSKSNKRFGFYGTQRFFKREE